uniref:PiggyBac transposable elementderived protein 3like [Haplochromis burtoni] n=1 Tax=Lepeophtheirus salmonis TaxID=72036 RepID=A0A0K2UVR7_LEPSM
MGGTDRMYKNIYAYRIGIRSRKWWWPLFACLINTIILNVCTGKTMDQVKFCRNIAFS